MKIARIVVAIFAAMLSAAAHPVDNSKTYLLSVTNLPLDKDGALKSFSFSTWGVTFRMICHIPEGWAVSAGGSLTPEGILKGEGSLGSSWFRETNPEDLKSLALVELYGPVLDNDIHTDGGDGLIPATFSGEAEVAGMDDDFKARLGSANIRLVEAKSCPETRAP